MTQLKYLIVIVDRKIEEDIVDVITKIGANFGHATYGKGTARTELLDIFGLGSTDRVVLSFAVKEEKINEIYNELRTQFEFEKEGKGIAFTIPITAVGGPASYFILSGGEKK